MPAETLNCPMCGAPASIDDPTCQHCGARLATVACPSCFGMMFIGEKFCSHCGALAQRQETEDGKKEICPRCKVEMNAVVIGKSHLHECPRCEGVWVDADTLHQICVDQEEQTAVLGIAAPVEHTQSIDLTEKIRYIPCPICGELMNRVNFANCSNVIVDVCRQHGTWFDRDELRRIVEFIRSGGMMKAREAELDRLEERKSLISTPSGAGAGATGLGDLGLAGGGRDWDLWKIGTVGAGIVLRLLLRR